MGGWFGCNRWACGQVICCVQLMNCPSIVTTSFTLNRDSLTFSSTFVLHALCCIFASFAISCYIALHVFHYNLSHSITCISLLSVTQRYMYFITCHIAALHVFHYYRSHSVTCISLLPVTQRYMYFIITCHIALHVFHYYLSHSVTCISL